MIIFLPFFITASPSPGPMKMTPRMTTLHEESNARGLPPLLNMQEEDEEEQDDVEEEEEDQQQVINMFYF